MPQEEYLTLTEARLYISVSEYKMQRLVADGALPAIENPYHKGSRLIRKADLDAWLAKAPRRPKPRKRQQPEAEMERAAAA